MKNKRVKAIQRGKPPLRFCAECATKSRRTWSQFWVCDSCVKATVGKEPGWTRQNRRH